MRRLVLLATAALVAASLTGPASSGTTGSSVLRVGTAVLDVTPAGDDPQYLGGFGRMAAPTAHAHDPLQVRAFVVRRGSTVAAFAIVDVQGWFAGYQEGPYGITDVRQKVGTWLANHGPTSS
jgi:hypothetical protein